MTLDPCRLCLSSTNSASNVNILDNFDLRNKIKECVSIEIISTEAFSKCICVCCLEKIENWHDFKIMCLNSKEILEAQVDIKDNIGNHDLLSYNQGNHQHTKDEQINKTHFVIQNTDVLLSSSQFQEDTSQNVMLNIEFDPVSCLNIHRNPEKDAIFIFSNTKCKSEKNVSVAKEAKESQESEIHTCDFCFQTFEYYTDYLDHQNTHNGEAIFKCEKCDVTFSCRLDLAWHEKRHKIPCHICGKDVQKQSMKLHLNKHTDKFKCIHCSLTFTCGPLLNEHIVARHMKLRQHFCDTCGKDFTTRSSLTLHLKTHSDIKHYKCDKCDYAGRTSISLRIHMSKHETGTYICEYCSKIFKSIRNLRDHLRRVHTSDKKYSCDICNMKFALRYLVEQHKRTHTGIHPYKCPKCFKTFARSDGLKEHMRTHDKNETYKCNHCTKIYGTRRGFKRHNCIDSIKA